MRPVATSFAATYIFIASEFSTAERRAVVNTVAAARVWLSAAFRCGNHTPHTARFCVSPTIISAVYIETPQPPPDARNVGHLPPPAPENHHYRHRTPNSNQETDVRECGFRGQVSGGKCPVMGRRCLPVTGHSPGQNRPFAPPVELGLLELKLGLFTPPPPLYRWTLCSAAIRPSVCLSVCPIPVALKRCISGLWLLIDTNRKRHSGRPTNPLISLTVRPLEVVETCGAYRFAAIWAIFC